MALSRRLAQWPRDPDFPLENVLPDRGHKVNAAFSSSLGFDPLTPDETLHREGSAYGDAARGAILAVYKRG